jgi:hypothetical protein
MKQTHKLLAFLVLTIFILAGCRLGKDSLEATKDRDAEFLMEKMIGNQVNVEWLSAKIKAKHESEDLNISFSGNLRMKKDSVIWLNIKKFGFEVARVLIQPDSIFVIDRFNDEFIAEDLQFVQRMVNFPANFQMIQSMLLGNPVFFTTKLESSLVNKMYQLKSTKGSSPSSLYILDGRYQLREMKMEETANKRFLEVVQTEFMPLKKAAFPKNRVLQMDSPDTGKMQVELQFTDIEWDVPKSIPFKKPANY